MQERANFDSYEEKLQKLKKEIEKGWNGPDSSSTIEEIIASKNEFPD